ncbi:site-2 protease family protein [Candidatus Woesearchaeota archaeon]|nr:site-2 protease family protein [Candidatus Woesearchaeota archaeon]
MNIDLLLLLVFYLAIILFYYRNKKDFHVENKIILLYKTKIGLKAMDRISKICPKFWKFLGNISIITGFAGMALILYLIIVGTIKMIFVKAPPALAPLLPGVKIPGLPDLSFLHWLVAIFVTVVIHEFSHGIYSQLHNIKVKSSGFALLGPLLGAFVEPDPKQLAKASTKAQLSILSAGSFSEIVTGFIFYIMFFSLSLPYAGSLYQVDNLTVSGIAPDSPFSKLNIEAPVTIFKINDLEPLKALEGIKPNQDVILDTDKGKLKVRTGVNPDDSSRGFIGIKDIKVNNSPKPNVNVDYAKFISWINLLVFWLVVVSFGIGLANLLPLGPFDGGKMFYVAMLAIFKDKKKAAAIFGFATLFCLFLLIINLLPYLWKFLLFLVTLLL